MFTFLMDGSIDLLSMTAVKNLYYDSVRNILFALMSCFGEVIPHVPFLLVLMQILTDTISLGQIVGVFGKDTVNAST
ncbi:hypothetical protein B0H19DRAFT_1256728 [Mycena capillaripes]|nr:hypothetical protein B0H19DRAFT_1256728 [Mycena capillaripes]